MDEEQAKREVDKILSLRTPKKSKKNKNNYGITIACSLVAGLAVQFFNAEAGKRINSPVSAFHTASISGYEVNLKSWSGIQPVQKSLIRAELYSLFPSIFLRKHGTNKWAPVQDYLRTTYSISHSNVRDIFRNPHGGWTAFEGQALQDKLYIKNYLSTVPKRKLIMAWGQKIPSNKFSAWVSIVKKHIEPTVGTSKAELFANEMLKN